MWFVCLRRALKPREQWQATVDGHLDWMRRQHEAGSILLSGPGLFKGERYGVYLIRTGSREEAERVAAADPFTAAGDCAYDLIEWEIHQIMGAGPFSASAIAAAR